MTVSMGIRHLDTGQFEEVPVATSEVFRTWWLPACEKLGLALVSHLHDGALNTVAKDSEIPRIVAELEALRAWAASEPDRSFMVERIDGILRAFRRTDPLRCSYDFG